MFEITMTVQQFSAQDKAFYAFGLLCNDGTNRFIPLYCFSDLSELPDIAGKLIDELVNLSNLHTGKMPVPEYVTKAFEKDDLF